VEFSGIVWFEVLTAVKMTMLLFWVVALCRLVGGYRHFRYVRATSIFRVEIKQVVELCIVLLPHRG
jgi:drug/metabolite transporter superfamily protein YnfA